MKVEIHLEGVKTILKPSTSLTIENGEVLRSVVADLVDQGVREFVLDLQEVSFVDHAGLGEIIRVYTIVSRLGGTVKIRNASERVKEFYRVLFHATFPGD